MADIWDGIIIGGAGGAIAGLTVSLVRYLHIKTLELVHAHRVYRWLGQKTSNELGKQYKSTREIASWNNLPEDRVRYICSINRKILLSIEENEDSWSLYERGDRSVYDDPNMKM